VAGVRGAGLLSVQAAESQRLPTDSGATDTCPDSGLIIPLGAGTIYSLKDTTYAVPDQAGHSALPQVIRPFIWSNVLFELPPRNACIRYRQ